MECQQIRKCPTEGHNGLTYSLAHQLHSVSTLSPGSSSRGFQAPPGSSPTHPRDPSPGKRIEEKLTGQRVRKKLWYPEELPVPSAASLVKEANNGTELKIRTFPV